jgi:hypothetical protein
LCLHRIKRIKISELTSDPELGLTISIAQIEELLQVTSKFDIVAYSIILEPPWLNFNRPGPASTVSVLCLHRIKHIKISELTSDPELGLTISIAQIEELLQVRSKSDIVAYSIILEPPWLNFKGKKTTNQNLR